jgi:hypothetical protein
MAGSFVGNLGCDAWRGGDGDFRLDHLGEVADHTAVLAVACSRCERTVRYNLDTLIAHYGEGFSIPRLLRLLSKDCPKRASGSTYDLCGVHCPELPRFFLPSRH